MRADSRILALHLDGFPSDVVEPVRVGAVARTFTCGQSPQHNEVIAPTSAESVVFEMGENECGFDDVADLAGAGGDVVEGAPAAGE